MNLALRDSGFTLFRKHAKAEKFDLAVDMLMAPTPAEEALWPFLLRMFEEKHRIRFRRQQVILGWIVDFYCPKRRLVIEADGPIHAARKAADFRRDTAMRQRCGILTLRFTNDEILRDPRAVAIKIWHVAKSRPIFRSWNEGLKISKTGGKQRTVR